MDNKFFMSLMDFGGKLAGNKYMSAIRDGFAYTMPLIMAGALATMLNNVVLSNTSVLASIIGEGNGFSEWTNTWIAPLFASLDAGTLSLLSVALVASLAYIRAEQENTDRITTILVTLGAFFVLMPLSRVSASAEWITNYLGSMGLFVAMFVGLVAPEIYIRITARGWTIKMPEMVPPAVGKGFAAIIPGAVTLITFGIIPWMFGTGLISPEMIINSDTIQVTNIFQLVENLIMTPLINIFGGADSDQFIPALTGVVGITFLKQFFWFFGLHGSNMVAPVVNSIWVVFDQLNVQSFAETGQAMYLWTGNSWCMYVEHGGAGATLALIIAMKMKNIRPDSRAIANMSIGPAIFNINEPVIFGVPLVLSPIYAIPFIFVTPILAAISFTAVWNGFGAPPVNYMPWTTPPILNAALATNFDIESIILSIITLVLAVLMYLPFVLIANKEYEKEQKGSKK